MLSRALSLATVTLLIGCFAAIPAQGQNLEAGKSSSQIFAGTCNACHKGPRGLLKTVPAGSLPGFLRQHYTTSGDMASLLAAFLISNGATDNRHVGSQPKPSKDAAPEGTPAGPPDQLDRFGRRLRPAPPPSEEAASPDADGLPPQAGPGHRGRNAKRLARPTESPDSAEPTADGQTPAQAAGERGPDGRKSAAKQKLSKRGKPGAEEPSKTEADAKTDAAKTDAAKTDAAKADAAAIEAAKGEPAKGEAATSNVDTAKGENTKPEGVKPSDDGKSESAKIEALKESGGGTPATRADPVPPVTPAPSDSPSVSAVVSSGTPEPPAPGAQSGSPAVRASVPPPPPVAPAGPPVPPISQ